MYSVINNSDWYRIKMKSGFEMENFLKLDIDRSDISNFVRLRIQYPYDRKGQAQKNRLCPLCKFEVENEMHFTVKM